MSLTSTPDQPQIEGRAVRWIMSNGRRKVTCWVRGDALEKLSGDPDLQKGAYLGTFHQHRDLLEARANAIFERGWLDGNDVVVRKENV